MYRTKNHNWAYLYILPVVLIFVVFLLYPILFNLYFSFMKWDGINKPQGFVGLSNYARMLHDKYAVIAIKNTIIYSILVVFLKLTIGLLLAVALRNIKLFAGFFRSFIFLPCVLTTFIVAFLFAWIFEYNLGTLNSFLRAVGLRVFALPWLADGKIALYSCLFVDVWQWVGFYMLFYNAAMMGIPRELYEAANIDGASNFQKFFRITLPLLRSTYYSLAIITTISAIRTFDNVWALTEGGPAGATEFFSTLILKKSFLLNDQGLSSAIAMIILILALIITAFQLKKYNKGRMV